MDQKRVLGRLAVLGQAILLAGCASASALTGGSAEGGSSYRVYDVENSRFVAMSVLAEAAAGADVVFFGEYHDSEGAHQAQQDFLQLVAESGREAVLGFEMFERDVQPVLDHYLKDMIDEEAFLASSRPWPNYETDYRPLLEIARRESWTVVATNLPQALATRIGREGLGALNSVPPEQRRMAPDLIECPLDEYWDVFVEAMTGEDSEESRAAHPTADSALQNIFQAQCARDAAMAEAILPFLGAEPLVIHVNGGFHTDKFLGLTSRVATARPAAKIVLISTAGIEDPARPDLAKYLDNGDYLIVVKESPENAN